MAAWNPVVWLTGLRKEFPIHVNMPMKLTPEALEWKEANVLWRFSLETYFSFLLRLWLVASGKSSSVLIPLFSVYTLAVQSTSFALNIKRNTLLKKATSIFLSLCHSVILRSTLCVLNIGVSDSTEWIIIKTQGQDKRCQLIGTFI